METKLIYDLSLVASSLKLKRWQTGLFRYAFELLKALHTKQEIDLFFAHTAYPVYFNNSKKYLREKGLQEKLCNNLVWPLPRNLMGRGESYFNKLYRLLQIDVNKVLLKRELYSTAEVYHTPFTPIPREVKAFKNLARIITIHDLYALINPLTNDHGIRSMKNLIASIGDDYVICVSNNTKNDLLNFSSQIKPEKVFVSHLAADPHKFYPCHDKNSFAAAQKKYGLPDQYFLSLCTLEPRKNLSHLIRSFLRFIKEQHIQDLHLVLVGPKGWDMGPMYSEIHDAGILKDRIIVTGRIPDEDLATVYSNAHSFYFMSLYEGFGLPALEAMQCGVPTVTSNNSSLPEVVGDGGIQLDSHDGDALCDVMYKMYYHEGFRDQYKERGLIEAKRFSWEKCASEHINIFQQIKSF